MAERGTPQVDCLLCGSPAPAIRMLSATFLRDSLAGLFPEPPPTAAVERDYRLHECGACSLAFAWPMAPGNAAFYDWITRQPDYYPDDRWEWSEVLERLAARAAIRPIRVLEVGCGSGAFLSRLSAIEGIEAVGLDTTPGAVDACRARGLVAHLGDLASIRGSGDAGRFDYCVSFHCLEHVDDPSGLVREMASVLAETGAILISAPFSPMSFERFGFDPLNHPPHHLSRWNRRACEVLGRSVGFDMHFKASPPPPLMVQAAMSTLRSLGVSDAGRAARRQLLLRRLPTFLREVARELGAGWGPEGRRGDTLLVEYSRRVGTPARAHSQVANEGTGAAWI